MKASSYRVIECKARAVQSNICTTCAKARFIESKVKMETKRELYREQAYNNNNNNHVILT